jgi:WD40 repeat protein
LDNTVRVWDATTGQELLCLCGHELSVTSVALSNDGRRIVSESLDNTVRVWDATTGQELLCLSRWCGHENLVRSVALSGDGRRIVSGSDDKTVRVWDATTGQELLCLRGHEDRVTSVALSGDGQRIVSKSYEKTVVWNLTTGECLQIYKGIADVEALAQGSQQFPFVAVKRNLETAFQEADSQRPVAWLAEGLEQIVTLPSGRAWVGSMHNHVHLIALEGTAPLVAQPARSASDGSSGPVAGAPG